MGTVHTAATFSKICPGELSISAPDQVGLDISFLMP